MVDRVKETFGFRVRRHEREPTSGTSARQVVSRGFWVDLLEAPALGSKSWRRINVGKG